jgi:putative DNA primase/helicase
MNAIVDKRDRLEEALYSIPADIERDKWWRVAAALKQHLGEPGFALFDAWSSAGRTYTAASAKATWKSLHPDGSITIKSLYAMAKEYGFTTSPRQITVADPTELERRRAQRAAAGVRTEKSRAASAKNAATLARSVWAKASPVEGDHPYIERKGVKPIDALREIAVEKLTALIGYAPTSSGTPLAGRVLIVPVSIDGEISTIEMIDETGLKTALSKGVKEAGYWIAFMPEAPARILLAEGAATALSAHECTGDAAVAALTSGNLLKAAKALRELHPNTDIVVLADIGNGQEKAAEAAEAIGGALALPDFGTARPDDATDFNDMHQLLGADSVRLAIDAAKADEEVPVDAQPESVSGFPAIEERPCYRVYDAWQEVDGRKVKPGVYLHSTKAERSDAAPALIDKWISTPLRVLATTSNSEDSEYGRLIEIWSPRGRWKKWAMPMSMLAGDGSEVRAVLLSEGLIFDLNDRNAILRYIATQIPPTKMRAASVTGWYGDAFVLPNTVIGADDIWFQTTGRTAPYASGGTFEEWRELAALAIGNPLLMLAFCTALAGPLLGPLNLAGAAISLYGDSSSGKTTGMDAGVSTWGGPPFKRTWRATGNGLEGTASLHSDTFLALDELGEIDPKSLYEAAYALINGTGKTRANRHGEARQASRWRIFLLSTGEVTVSGRMNAGGIEAKAGQELRILDVPVQGKYGLFDDLRGRATGAALSDEIRNLAAQNYGHAGPRFVAALIEAMRGGLQLSDELRPILDRFGVEGQERRAARTFAICGLAGELAARWNIVPWEAGSAISAARHAFRLWQQQRSGNGHGAEHAAILRSISDFIDRHGSARFSNREGSADLVRDRAGWWEQDGESRLYLFTSGALREATKGYDINRVVRALKESGAVLNLDSKAHPKTIWIADEKDSKRLYRIAPGKLLFD